MSSPWPDSPSSASSEDIAERSSSILWGSICTWCVMQGFGARDSEVQRCQQLGQAVKRDEACIARLCREQTEWEVDQLREEIGMLIAHGADINAMTKAGRTALHEGAKAGNANAVKACLSVSLEGLSAEDMLDLELEAQSKEAKADFARKQQNELGMRIDGSTNLLKLNCAHLAAMRGHVDVLKVLEEMDDLRSASVPKACLFDREDVYHFTPAMYAAEAGNVTALHEIYKSLTRRFGDRSPSSGKYLMHLTSFSNSSLERAPPRLRNLSHYAAMNGRVNVLRFLDSIGCLYHVNQDGECLTPIDLAIKFERVGAQAFLKATCKHPFLDNDSHCGVCKTFVRREGGPIFSPISGFYNMTVCDAILDAYLDERRLKDEERQRRRRLALEARAKKKKGAVEANGAGNASEDTLASSARPLSSAAAVTAAPAPAVPIRRREIEIEDVVKLVQKVVTELGIDGEWEQNEAKSEARDAVAKFRQENDDLDAINAPTFHKIVCGLACVSNTLDDDHLGYVAAPKAAKMRLRTEWLC